MHTVILCAAGLSTRHPGSRPKWALTHPSGRIMAAEALSGLRGERRVVMAVRADHAAELGGTAAIVEAMPEGTSVLQLENSESQVDTVYQVLNTLGPSVDGPVTIKDCDNAIEYELPEGNTIAVASLAEVGRMAAAELSYVDLRPGGYVHLVVEKRVIGDLFCCGAYTFRSVDVFLRSAEDCAFVSEVANVAIHSPSSEQFTTQRVTGYEDWGTAKAWQEYLRTWKTLFVDIDGVLLTSGHQHFVPSWGRAGPIVENVKYLNRLYQTGRVTVVLTTSRPEEWRALTEAQLAKAGVGYDRLIMDLPVCSRAVVNDFAPERGQHTAFAVNLERNSNRLENHMRAALRED